VTDTAGAPAPVPPPASGIGAVAAIVGTFTKPSDTFGRLIARPTWWLPFLLSVVIGTLTYVAVAPKIDLEGTIRASIEKSGRSVAAGTVERQVAFMHTWAPAFIAGVTVVGAAAFFVIALVLWGGARAMGGDVRYPQMMAIWAHSGLPSVIGSLVAIPLFLRVPDGTLTQTSAEKVLASNVGAFLDDSASAALRTLGSSLDIFSVAVLLLLVLGFRRIPGLSKGAATAVPIVLWGAFVAVKVAWKAVMG
jgi:hypothetical protein